MQFKEFFAKAGLQFQVTYSDGMLILTTGGNIRYVSGEQKGKLNVFVSDHIPER